MKNMKIITCEQCFNSLPVPAVGSYCGIMCPDCGWQPDCSGEEICETEDNNIKSIKVKDSDVNS